jgi:hypothetical protein
VRVLDTILTCMIHPEVRDVLLILSPLIGWAAYSLYADFRWLLRGAEGDKRSPLGPALRLVISGGLGTLYLPLMLLLWNPTSWIGA